MNPKIVTKPAFTVVGLRINTRPKSPEIPKLWDQFVPRMDELDNIAEPYASYGVMASAGDTLDYMAGNPVSDVSKVPADMSHWNIPEQTYAVFEATLPTLGQVFDYIYQSWLPASDFVNAAGPILERYGENFSPENPVVDIYIPVKLRKE